MKIRILLSLFILPVTGVSGLDFEGLVTPDSIAAHRAALDLTADQESQLSQICESAKAEAESLEAAIHSEEEELKDLLKSDSLSPEAADAQLQDLLDAEAKLKRLQLKTLVTLRSALTPEQLAKAIKLAGQNREETAALEARIEAKADRLKTAFEELDLTAPVTLAMRGTEITEMLRRFELTEAEQALDALIAETGIDEATDTEPIDFSTEDPGDIDLEVLKQRYETVTEAAGMVISLPLLRQLVKGRDALELAKQNEDATQVGRILTWAEKKLAL